MILGRPLSSSSPPPPQFLMEMRSWMQFSSEEEESEQLRCIFVCFSIVRSSTRTCCIGWATTKPVPVPAHRTGAAAEEWAPPLGQKRPAAQTQSQLDLMMGP